MYIVKIVTLSNFFLLSIKYFNIEVLACCSFFIFLNKYIQVDLNHGLSIAVNQRCTYKKSVKRSSGQLKIR